MLVGVVAVYVLCWLCCLTFVLLRCFDACVVCHVYVVVFAHFVVCL